MSNGNTSDAVTADVAFEGDGWKFETKVRVPRGPMAADDLLPLARALTGALLDVAVQTTEKGGERISCGKGCAYCCRQMVPVAEVEARRLRAVVDALPEPRRG